MLPVEIAAPKNIAEVWKLLQAHKGNCKFLAGGTDLVIAGRFRKEMPALWLDISKLKELRGIAEKPGLIYIGAGEKIAVIEASAKVRKWLPVLAQACGKFASPTLRNMATLGGNCANASPSADALCALCAESAVAVISRAGKVRRVAVESLLLGPKKTALAKNDLILGFELPKKAHAGKFMKLATREAFAISKVSASVAVYMEKGVVAKASIRLGAVGPTVLAAKAAQDALAGQKLDRAAIDKAAEAACATASPIDDVRSNARYRREMVRVLVRRALETIAGEKI